MCRRFENSWACARMASLSPRTLSSSRTSDSSSRAIAQRHHRAEVPSLPVDGHAVGDDHAVAVHQEDVLAGRAAREQVGEA